MTRIAAWSLALTFSICASAFADPVSVTILHTNDLHSHFRSERTPLGLGGIARIKTVVRRVRKQIPDALLVDGGDWSEGNIYYNEGTGRESLKMMDDLGYDVAVVGNHDWLNGPDTILKIVDEAQPQVSLVSANLDASKYGRAQDFRAAVLPYVIKSVDGVKIAFIGLSTYEKIYDHFFAPVGVLDPIPVTRALAKQLRPLVDAIVVISHNAVKMNQAVLEAVPELDLIVGAHDHRQLNAPIVVNRLGAHPGWIVETGCWGRNLGRVDMQVTPRAEADATGVPSV
ncbi:MAG: bifunctional metallophosphatase/5'-nucleotidase, partial [Bdellovibrionota bacterium]